MPRLFLYSFLMSTAMVSMGTTRAHAVSITDLGVPGEVSGQYFSALSANGSVVAGGENSSNGVDGFIWINGVKQQLSLGGAFGITLGAVTAVSADGAVVAGGSANASGYLQAYRWENGTMQQLPTLGGLTGLARAMSADGAVVVGRSANTLGNHQAFRWENGTIQELSLGGVYADALAVSADGRVVVGYSYNASSEIHAFRWENGTIQQLPTLGGNGGGAFAVSADGRVVVGYSYNALSQLQAFRWENGTIQELSLGGDYGAAGAVSADGRVVVGISGNASYQNQAFRWENGTIQELSLGGTQGEARSVSADGTVVVGQSENASSLLQAFRWTALDGTRAVADILGDAGVDMTDWSLDMAHRVSADGKVIVGTGTYQGNSSIFLANMATGGVTTPQDLSTSLQTIQQSGQQVAAVARNYAPNGLFLAQNIQQIAVPVRSLSSTGNASSFANYSPAAGGAAPSKLSAFLLGSVGLGHNNTGGNYQLNGTLGVSAQVSPDWTIGAGMIAGRTRSDLSFNGDSRLDALGGMAMVSYVPYQSPLRIYGTAFAADLTLDNKRGYLNGSGLDYSRGGSDGFAYGGAVRVGYEKAIGNWEWPTSMMPYIEGRYSKTKLDGYSENGGAFAATFGSQEDDYIASRLGIEFRQQVTDDVQLMFRPAWGHRLSGGGDGFTATTAGLAMGYAGQAGDRDWAEASVGGSYQATEKLSFTTEVTARTGDTSEPLVSMTIGAFMKF